MSRYPKIRVALMIIFFLLGLFFLTPASFKVEAECPPQCGPCDYGFHYEVVQDVGVRCFRSGGDRALVDQGCCVSGSGSGSACTVEWQGGPAVMTVGETAQFTAFARGALSDWSAVYPNNSNGNFSPIYGNAPTMSSNFTATAAGSTNINWRVYNSSTDETYCQGSKPLLILPPCSPTVPTAATLIDPANGSTVPRNSANLSWSDSASWGNACPSNNNQYKVFLSQNCSGVYTQYNGYDSQNGNNFTKNVSGLAWGSNYCWFVQKDNGSLTANSSVWQFTVNKPPTNISHGFNQPNTCTISNGVSGRWDNPSGEAENPISYSFTFQDPEADRFLGSYLVFVPRNNMNADQVNANTLYQLSLNANAVGVYISSSGAVSTLTSGPSWGAGSASGNLLNAQGTATVMNIGSDTRMIVNTNQVTANFKIRMENTFPSGNFNVYGMVMMQNSDGTIVSSYATPTDSSVFKKLDSWIFDLVNPGVSLTGPTYNYDKTFNIIWGATDNIALGSINSYAWSDQASGAQLTDQTIPLTINLGNFAYNYPTASNAGVTLGNLGNHKYKTTGVDAGYTYKIVARDTGCNISETSLGATEPKPWLISYQGVSSAQGGYQLVIPDNPSFKVPFTSDVGTPYLSTYGAIAGNSSVPTFRISKTQTYVTNYINEAVKPPTSSDFTNWYDLVVSRVMKNTKGVVKTVSGNKSFSSNLSANFGVPAGITKVIYNLTGNLTITAGDFCDVQAIILVSGDLHIQGGFKNVFETSACMFVVKGNVTVDNGNVINPKVDIASSSQANYETLDAYIVTEGKLQTTTNTVAGDTNKYQGLFINGGVLPQQLNLHRDLNYTGNLTDPSIVFDYNPSFRMIFGDDLADRSYSIREVL